MIKAALFDLDGVVVDSESQYTKFWGSQFQLYYPKEKGLEQQIKGMTLVEIFSSYFNGQRETQEAITRRLNEFERKMSYDYISGFQDFIKKAKEASLATAIVTSSNQMKMTNVFRCHPELSEYFDAVLTRILTRVSPTLTAILKLRNVLIVSLKNVLASRIASMV